MSLQPKRLDPKEDKAYQSVLDIVERLQAGDATNSNCSVNPVIAH